MTAAMLDPDRCRVIASRARKVAASEYTASWAKVDAILTEAADQLDAAADLAERQPPPAEATEQPDHAVQAVRVGPADTVVIVQALELWDRYLTAPHADIKRILAELTGKAPS